MHRYPIKHTRLAGVLLLLFGIGFFASSTRAEAPGHYTARGIIVAAHKPIISSQISGVIQHIAVTEGETFKKGDLLVAFDDGLFRAQTKKAEAELEAARAKLGNMRKLALLESVGGLSVALAEAEVKSRMAEMEIARLSLSRCAIRAPFNGRLVSSFTRVYETVAPNQKIFELVSSDDLEIEVLAPSKWLTWLKPGLRFRVLLDEGRGEIMATIAAVGAVVDPVSKMVKIKGRLSAGNTGLLPGMTTTVRFPAPEIVLDQAAGVE